jgi:hypothetical protein
MMRTMRSLVLWSLAALAVWLAPATAEANKKAKKYYFELIDLTVKPEVKAEIGKAALPRVKAQLEKALATHPQLVAVVEGAPDPDAKPEAYRKYLQKKGLSGAYKLTVEITEASEELVPLEDKKNAQRIVVSVGIHILGETIPGRTMGFTGDGAATVKQEVGMKFRDKDRQLTWDAAAETAIADALKVCFAKLAIPPKKQ